MCASGTTKGVGHRARPSRVDEDQRARSVLADGPCRGSGSFPIRGDMADNLELNVEAPSETLRRQASGFRRLAGEILDGEFRGRLLELALDYEREADNPEHGNFPQQ